MCLKQIRIQIGFVQCVEESVTAAFVDQRKIGPLLVLFTEKCASFTVHHISLFLCTLWTNNYLFGILVYIF